MELIYIEPIVELTGGNKAKAGRILGIDVSTLWRELKK